MAAGGGISEEERRGRRRRLAIIVVVAVGALGAFVLWGRSVTGHDAAKTRAATAELHSVYRGVDVAKLQEAYTASITAGHPTRIAGLPEPTLSRWMRLDFQDGNVLVAEYRINGTTVDSCVGVRVTGPTPNRVRVLGMRCR